MVLEKVHVFSRTWGATCVSSKLDFASCLPDQIQHFIIIQSSSFIPTWISLYLFHSITSHCAVSTCRSRHILRCQSPLLNQRGDGPRKCTGHHQAQHPSLLLSPLLQSPVLRVTDRPSPLCSPLLLVTDATVSSGSIASAPGPNQAQPTVDSLHPSLVLLILSTEIESATSARRLITSPGAAHNRAPDRHHHA